jgi:tagatose-6-phosphate ketose/aldose isomerase
MSFRIARVIFAVSFASSNEGRSELSRPTRVYETEVQRLLERPEEDQRADGYFDTLREILQQPGTWLRTAEQMLSESAGLLEFIEGTQAVVLTGSGSSEYAGECVRLVLQNELAATAQTIGGGVLLTDGGRAISPRRPCLMVSLARSGDSPESAGATLADPRDRTCDQTSHHHM